jgi:5-methyltetrahydropteroyltriglutamate--homocysteine methyltransferase
MTTKYQADQVGSLLRPAGVLRAREAYGQGRIGLADLRAVEDEAILEALERQRQVGVDVFTDGEFRRGAWQTDMAEAVDGFVEDHIAMSWHGPNAGVEGSAAQVVGGKLRQRRRLTAHESAFLKEHAPGPYKVTIPSASTFRDASYKPGLTERFYPSRSDLLDDLVRIVRDEIQALAAEGVPYVQLDAPRLAYYVDPRIRGQMSDAGLDPDQALDDAIAAENTCLEGIAREGLTLGFHLCRGNSRSRWRAEGGYDPIAEKVFGSLRHDRFLLEYDSERAGGFEPLRFVPKGKTVVLGLVTTKDGRLESQDDLLRRIDEAAKYVPLDSLALSPQCGFASIAEGNLLSPDDQWRKLELIVDTATMVWGRA